MHLIICVWTVCAKWVIRSFSGHQTVKMITHLMRMRRPHWGQMFWSWPQASAEDQPGYDEPKMLILNSGCEILTQRGQWNGIAVKSTSGRICKRAVPRKTPAPKDRRSDVNTTCKYKLERVYWSKKNYQIPFLQISYYKFLLQPETWSAIFQD